MTSRNLLSWSIFASTLVLSTSAQADWSIVAANPQTGEVGIAGAWCANDSLMIAGVVPGKGVVAAQGEFSSTGRNTAMTLIESSTPVNKIIEALTNVKVDNGFQKRQYGIATLYDGVGAFTGNQCLTERGDQQNDTLVVSAQGNSLESTAALASTLAAFEATNGCRQDLADRLIAALEAGGLAGGDTRCDSQTALSAFIVVAKTGDTAASPYLQLFTSNQTPGGDNPVVLLRTLFDGWRQTHPANDDTCTDSSDTQTDSGSTTDSNTTTTTSSTSDDTNSTTTTSSTGTDSTITTSDTGSTTTSSTDTNDTGNTSTTSSTDTQSTGDSTTATGTGTEGGEETQTDSSTDSTTSGDTLDEDGDSTGCNCDVKSGRYTGLGLAALGLAFGWRRRRTARARS